VTRAGLDAAPADREVPRQRPRARTRYPFLIDEHGISVLPVTGLGLTHESSNERVSSGVPQLDQMLGGKATIAGSSILATGTAGSGKTSLAAQFALSTCKPRERCLYLAFEESPSSCCATCARST
jgi:circadian clock protein KaiC